VHRLDHVHEQRVRQQRHQHRHLRAALRGQRTRGRVGHVAELLRRGFHARHQVGRHAAFAAQRARRGDGADLGFAGHVLQGDAPAGASSSFGGGQGFSLSMCGLSGV
jgi:hypothetical protein